METRRIVKFGKTSHIITLPKAWMTKNKLEKGDILHMEESGTGLLLMPKKPSGRNEIQSIEIDISKLSSREIKRKIISAYIQNYSSIRIYGKDIMLKAADVKDATQNLMALEIMEETATSIIAKDFLRMDEISPMDLFKRMDIITRAMYLDSLKALDEDIVENIYQRDSDVNRLSFLIYRKLRYQIDNPCLNSKGIPNQKFILDMSNATRDLERIADNVKRIAKLFRRLEIDQKGKKRLISLMDKVYSNYESTMRAFYKGDIDEAFRLSNDKAPLIDEARAIYEDYWDVKWMPFVLDKIKDIVACLHQVGREVYH